MNKDTKVTKDTNVTREKYLRNRRKEKIQIISCQIILLVGFISIWEISSQVGLINDFLFSKPSSIISLLYKYLINNQLFHHIGISLLETFLGLIIGTLVGLIIGIILWWNKFIAKVVEPFLMVLNALPKTALAPILIIWAGMGIRGVTVVAMSISLVLTIISAYHYFIQIEDDKIKMLQSFRATKWQILTKLVLPSNYPNIINIIKINIGLTWVGVIVGEFIVSRAGIGYLIVYGSQVFRMDLVMMGVLILGIIAYLMYEMVNLIETRFRKKRGEKL